MMPGFGIADEVVKAERELLHRDLERRRMLRENLTMPAQTAPRRPRLRTAIRSLVATDVPAFDRHPSAAGHV